jgi:hypothetical protein
LRFARAEGARQVGLQRSVRPIEFREVARLDVARVRLGRIRQIAPEQGGEHHALALGVGDGRAGRHDCGNRGQQEEISTPPHFEAPRACRADCAAVTFTFGTAGKKSTICVKRTALRAASPAGAAVLA